MKLFKANETLWKYISIYEALRVSLAIVSANMLWFVIILFVRIKNYPRSLPVIATLIILAEMLGFRLMYRYIRKKQYKSQNTIIH